jgi:hypothetical protein
MSSAEDQVHLADPASREADGEERVHVAPPTTGDTAVDEALASLATLDELPVTEHHDRFVRVHDALSAALDGRTGQDVSTSAEPSQDGG